MKEVAIKLNVLLAKTDHLASSFKKCLVDYLGFFKKEQGQFKGDKKTYTPKDGTIDEPSKRGTKNVVTTVDEKLLWLKETNSEYIDALFSQEATNASGKPKAALIVDGIDFGTYSSLELLRLKSIIEDGKVEEMYAAIPVRNDDEEWIATTDDSYLNRAIFESPKEAGTAKSMMKESYILPDPNLSSLKDSGSYKPVIGTKDTIIELGEYTRQKFTGEWSHRQRAELLRRRSILLNSVIAALKTANDVEVVSSEMTAEKLFNYLHGTTPVATA